jgi:colanic acid biosynthesis glycosyl transferase WcaI
VLRLPLWPGRGSGIARVRQELSFVASLSTVAPLLPTPDVVIAVTPSFPALATTIAFTKVRHTPWVMWLQDIVTDGASTTGQLSDGLLLSQARRFERASYAAASKVVVVSQAFRDNLLSKGVPGTKIERIFNPLTRDAKASNDLDALSATPPKILAMGNIGHTQGLDRIVDAFQASAGLGQLGARLVIAGGGVAADDVRRRIACERVSMPGVLYGEELTPELRTASLGLVSQRADVTEFNMPSKLMNYMAYGIPVLASVKPESEIARIVRESGSGWVTDAAEPSAFAEKAGQILRDRDALRAAGVAGYSFAHRHFTPASVAARFETVVEGVVRADGCNGRSASAGERIKLSAGEQEVSE